MSASVSYLQKQTKIKQTSLVKTCIYALCFEVNEMLFFKVYFLELIG